MKRFLLALVVVASVGLQAQGKITLTTPIAKPSLADYLPVRLLVQQLPTPAIGIVIRGADGVDVSFDYPCRNGCTAMDTTAEVQAQIDGLNSVANMSVRTLWRRICDRLVIDFPEKFPGAVTVQ